MNFDTPPLACDCHVHIYEDRFPLAAAATFRPPHAPVSAYREMQTALGLQRAVLVQPTGYGLDNACLLDALSQMGDAARGIAVVPADTRDDELQRLHAAGVRGVRFMMIAGSGGALTWDALPLLAARMAPLGWTVNLQLDGRDLPQVRELIDSLPGKVVIDHTGKFLEPVAPQHASFCALQAVLGRPQRWVKLSAPYETSKSGPPAYDDVSLLARTLVASHPDRCLWASNWPHPNRRPRPDDADMLGLLYAWAPDAAVRRRILVENAAAAFDFAGTLSAP
jgi:D-galactarolactone isomerase